MAEDSRTLVMLAIAERTDGATVVSAKNEGSSPIRARLKVCGIDRETLSEGQTPKGEFQALTWGKLGGRLLVLESGAVKTSLPFKVAGDKTHVVVFGEGDNLMNCHCDLERPQRLIPGRTPGRQGH